MQGFFSRAVSAVIFGNQAAKEQDKEDDVTENLNESVGQFLANRSKGIQTHVASLSPETYLSNTEIRILATTFNVNGSRPLRENDLRSWLTHPGDKWPERSGDLASWGGPDLLFIGFQEIVSLNAMNVVVGNTMENIDAWEAAVGCALNQLPLPTSYLAAQSALDGLSGFSGAETGGTSPLGFGVTKVLTEPEEHEQYVRIGSHTLVGVHLSVWARKPVAPHISAWQDAEVRTGNLGFGNKGAVMARMRVYDEPIAVMVAHLSHGEQAADELRRQADFTHICKNGIFSSPTASSTNASADLGSNETDPLYRRGTWTRGAVAAAQPNVIFMGDLNCRIRMPIEDVFKYISEGGIDRLLARDELIPQLGRPGAYEKWREGAVTFLPTYKFAKGTDRYVGVAPLEASPQMSAAQSTSSLAAGEAAGKDPAAGEVPSAMDLAEEPAEGATDAPPPPDAPRPEAAVDITAAGSGIVSGPPPTPAAPPPRAERARTPAWTDRILHSSTKADALHMLLYARSDITLSDHKPVIGAFLLHADVVDEGRLQERADEAQKTLDLTANNAQPRCSVVGNIHDIGELRYNDIKTCTCTITNTGEGLAEWTLKTPPTDDAPDGQLALEGTPAWMHVDPTEGLLAPGASTDITFKMGVAGSASFGLAEPATAEKIVTQPGAASCTMTQALVLRIAGGADHFVIIDGTFVPSFLALTVSTLAARAEEGKALPLASLSGDAFSTLAAAPFPESQWDAVPWQLQTLLRFLARDSSLATKDIFSDSFTSVRTQAAIASSEGSMMDEASSTPASVQAIVSAIDAGGDIPEGGDSPHAAAVALLTYFKLLPRPFLPESLSSMVSAAAEGMTDPNTAAVTVKESLASPEEWAVLCCTVHLLKAVIKQTHAPAVAGDGSEEANPAALEERQQTLRTRLAVCFAEVWFPAVSMRDLDSNARPEEYTALLHEAANTTRKQAKFLEMFLL